jgi:hypothetical protein
VLAARLSDVPALHTLLQNFPLLFRTTPYLLFATQIAYSSEAGFITLPSTADSLAVDWCLADRAQQ